MLCSNSLSIKRYFEVTQPLKRLTVSDVFMALLQAVSRPVIGIRSALKRAGRLKAEIKKKFSFITFKISVCVTEDIYEKCRVDSSLKHTFSFKIYEGLLLLLISY